MLKVHGSLSGWLEKKQAACAEAAAAGDPLLQFTAEPDKGHQRLLEEFVREIRGGGRPPVSPLSSGLKALQICLAAVLLVTQNRPDGYDKGSYETAECFLAPEWQEIFERKAREILGRI